MILRGLYGVWIIGYVACLSAFRSVFFSSLKTIFKAYSTPGYLSSFQAFFLIAILTPPRQLVDQSRKHLSPRQLLNTWWIDREISCLFDSFLTTGGSIELLFLYLMGCSSRPPRYLYLSKTNFLTPSSTNGLTPLDTSSVEIY